MELKVLILVLIFWELPNSLNCYNANKRILSFDFKFTDNGIHFTALQDDVPYLYGILLNGKNTTGATSNRPHNYRIGDVILSYEVFDDGIIIKWDTPNLNNTLGDCFQLLRNWYGGPERRVQKYPIQFMTIDGDEPYIIKKSDNFAVAERYWLNSLGFYIFVNNDVPLFVEQNKDNSRHVCFNARIASPYFNRTRNTLEYRIIFKDDVKEAHLHAINNYLGKPLDSPHHKMVTEPIWTTWAKFKKNINDETVVKFAEDIRNQGYVNGQIEIDDQWETCYGSQEFDKVKFSDIKNSVAKLKGMNYRVTLWVHPFVNSDCQNVANEGIEKGYFVKDVNGNTNASWWNGDDAMIIDFTNPEAAEWFSARLRKLQEEIGIDSFKFDAGETNYLNHAAVYTNVDTSLAPSIWSQNYLRTSANFGNLIEVRSATGTQDLPIFVRMLDKDSNWGQENGLYTLLTTLFQMNLNGYPFVLPDMIGGNGYNGPPDAELLVRWTQANAFMPAMQFSYLPWEITSDEFDAAAIVKKFVDLHTGLGPEFIDGLYMSTTFGWPMNPPVWWVDPTDLVALTCDDEYMLGDVILVAPVIQKGARSRDVFLPKGRWIDGNNGTVYEGGHVLYNYPAPIDVLPYFYRDK